AFIVLPLISAGHPIYLSASPQSADFQRFALVLQPARAKVISCWSTQSLTSIQNGTERDSTWFLTTSRNSLSCLGNSAGSAAGKLLDTVEVWSSSPPEWTMHVLVGDASDG